MPSYAYRCENSPQWSTFWSSLCFALGRLSCKRRQTADNIDWNLSSQVSLFWSIFAKKKNWFTLSAVIAVFFLASSRVISLNQIQIYHDLSKYIHQSIIYNLMLIGITHYHRKLKTTLKNRYNEHTNYRSCLLYARNYNLGVALENCCITAFLVINLKLTSTFSTTPFQSSHAPLIIYVYTHSCLHYFPFCFLVLLLVSINSTLEVSLEQVRSR